MKLSGRIKTIFLAVTILLACEGISHSLSTQILGQLPRSTPKMEGVSSAGIIDFLNAIDTGSVELHSFMFIRHGKVIAEGWREPYAPFEYFVHDSLGKFCYAYVWKWMAQFDYSKQETRDFMLSVMKYWVEQDDTFIWSWQTPEPDTITPYIILERRKYIFNCLLLCL